MFVYYLLLILSISTFYLFSEESGTFSERYLEKIKTTELTLKNGMHLYLRPNKASENEVVVQMAAVGGYSTFLNDHLSSARLAADIVWGSGFSSLTSDQLSALLYDSSIEFEYLTKPFYRKIVGESTKSSLPALLKLINEFFTRPHFNKTGLDEVVSLSLENLEIRDLDPELNFENAFFKLNTQYDPTKLLLTKENLDKVDLKKAKKAFKRLYGNPKDFHCIIVGDFSIDSIKPFLASTLGSIALKPSLPLKLPEHRSFPESNPTKIIPLKYGEESLSRLTFPIQVPINENNFWKLEIVCQTIEAHLRNSLHKYLKAPNGIRVSYEFPFYPSPLSPWLFIQYRSDFEKSTDIAKMIGSEIKNLQNKGPDYKILKAILESQKNSDDLWQNEDEYWLSFLTNAALLNWSPEKLFINKESTMNVESLRKTLAELINCDCYSRLTSKPE